MSSDSCQSLLRAIADRTCTVGVIGLGYVGLPLIDAFTQAGFQCIGFDVDPGKVKSLLGGKSYIKHIDDAKIAEIEAEMQPFLELGLTRNCSMRPTTWGVCPNRTCC